MNKYGVNRLVWHVLNNKTKIHQKLLGHIDMGYYICPKPSLKFIFIVSKCVYMVWIIY